MQHIYISYIFRYRDYHMKIHQKKKTDGQVNFLGGNLISDVGCPQGNWLQIFIWNPVVHYYFYFDPAKRPRVLYIKMILHFNISSSLSERDNSRLQGVMKLETNSSFYFLFVEYILVIRIGVRQKDSGRSVAPRFFFKLAPSHARINISLSGGWKILK